MGDDNFPFFEVDQARYFTLEAVLKGLDSELIKQIKVSSIAANKYSASNQNWERNGVVFLVIIL